METADTKKDVEKEICPECGKPFDEHDFCKFNEGDLIKFTGDIAKTFTNEAFPLIWSEEKEELKEMSRKDVCREMFFRGAVEMLYSYIKENEDFNEDDKDELWDDGGFVQSMSSEDMNKKMSTFHKGHDEDMNFNCKVCEVKISAHNKDWHDGMCDNCFNNKYHPNLHKE